METTGMVVFGVVALVAVWRVGVWRDRAEEALADAEAGHVRDGQMIRRLEAEVARSRAAAEALRPKLGGPT